MQIFLNGEPRRIDAAITVAQLLAREGQAGRPVAVEVNQCIVPRSAHATHQLCDGDRVEVVTAFGGG